MGPHAAMLGNAARIEGVLHLVDPGIGVTTFSASEVALPVWFGEWFERCANGGAGGPTQAERALAGTRWSGGFAFQ